MKEMELKRHNIMLTGAITAVVIVVFSLMIYLTMVEHRYEMDKLQRTISILRNDVLTEIAKVRKYQILNCFHGRLHRREATRDRLLQQTFSLLTTNFTQLDTITTSFVALENVTTEIVRIRDEIQYMKTKFADDVLRLDEIVNKSLKCTKSIRDIMTADEVLKLVLKMTDTLAGLKRVIVLSTLKSATIRNNMALLSRFECTLREGMDKIEKRIEILEQFGQNITDRTMTFGSSLNDVRMDVHQVASEVKSGRDALKETIVSKLSLMKNKCSDSEFLKTIYTSLETSVSRVINSTKVMESKLEEISCQSSKLSSNLNGTNENLVTLQQLQTNVKDICAHNNEQAVVILNKLDLFNETEQELNHTIIEYCAQKQGCVKVKEFIKHCYKVFDKESASWYAATETCNSEGGYLVEINSDTEYQKLANFIIRTRYYWIGGTDLNSEGSWYWSNSKDRVWLNAWQGSNPNNDGGREHCMHLYANRISWNDANCYTRQSFICERDYNCDGWD